MRNLLISSILALAVIGFSGCGAKAGVSCAKPVLPSCVPACKKTPVPCPC